MKSGDTGWRLVPLGELVTCTRRSIAPDRVEASTPYVGLEHIAAGTGEWDSVTVGSVELKSSKYAFAEGDVLYGKLRPNLRKCIVATVTGVCSTDILPLTPHDPANRWYIALLLRSQMFAERVDSVVGGASLPRVGVKDLLKLEIPAPPDEERDRLSMMAEIVAAARLDLANLALRLNQLEESVVSEGWGQTPWDSAMSSMDGTQGMLWRSQSM